MIPSVPEIVPFVRYGAWLSVACCVAGGVYTAAQLARRQHPGEHLVWTLSATVIAGFASALLGAIT
ncbi:MAG: hypothetical protein ACLP8S_15685 [Solirubrobacteraceae bacterium]